MSLINDALKRANEKGRPNDASREPGVGLRPRADTGGSSAPLRAIVAVLAGGMVLLAGWFIWNALKAANEPQSPASGATTRAVASPPQSRVTSPAKPEAGAGQTSGTARPAIQVNTNVVVRRPEPLVQASAATSPDENQANPVASAVPTAPVAATSASEPVPAWPEFKLQAIFYRLTKSSARVNGKVVWVGDSVDGARVVAIDRESVHLEFRGQTNVFQVSKGK